MTQGFLIVAGFIAWLLVAVGIGCLLVYGAGSVWQAIWGRYERLTRADERREVGTRLIGAAYWFSEDAITMNLLIRAGQDMLKGLDPLGAVNDVRDEWRAARRKQAARTDASESGDE